MIKNVIQAQIIKCTEDSITVETKTKNKLDLFLGHVHPEYKKLNTGQVYQFLLDIYPSCLEDGRDDINENAEENYLLDYNFIGHGAYGGIVHGEIIKSDKLDTMFKHWIKVDCGIVNWRNEKQIKQGKFVRIRGRLDVDKIYDLDDNFIKPEFIP